MEPPPLTSDLEAGPRAAAASLTAGTGSRAVVSRAAPIAADNDLDDNDDETPLTGQSRLPPLGELVERVLGSSSPPPSAGRPSGELELRSQFHLESSFGRYRFVVFCL